MRIFLFLFLIAPLPGGDEVENLGYAASYALVIGIDHYPKYSPPLKTAVADAQAVADLLKRQGFQVTLLVEGQATRREIIRFVEEDLAPKLEPRDRVIFYFAGHGHTSRLQGKDFGYIVPYDGDDSTTSYISMATLKDLSAKMHNALHQLFLMDSCYGGSITRGTPRNTPSYHRDRYVWKGRQAITAGGPDQVVLDGDPQGHSPFTAALLRALSKGEADMDGDGLITYPELYAFVSNTAHNPNQTPIGGELPDHESGGEFIFLSPKGRVSLGKSSIMAPFPTDSEPRGTFQDKLPAPEETSYPISIKESVVKFGRIPEGTRIEISSPTGILDVDIHLQCYRCKLSRQPKVWTQGTYEGDETLTFTTKEAGEHYIYIVDAKMSSLRTREMQQLDSRTTRVIFSDARVLDFRCYRP